MNTEESLKMRIKEARKKRDDLNKLIIQWLQMLRVEQDGKKEK